MGETRILSKGEVLERVGVTFPTLWKLMRENKFPRSVIIGDGKVGWFAHEIDEYLAKLPRQQYKGDPGRETGDPKKVKAAAASAAHRGHAPGKRRRRL